MDERFIQAIVICLLSKKELKDDLNLTNESNTYITTPEKPKGFDTKEKYLDSGKKHQSKLNKNQPSFKSGVDKAGNAIYTSIRVIPEEIVDLIEKDLLQQAKVQSLSSETTLTDCM